MKTILSHEYTKTIVTVLLLLSLVSLLSSLFLAVSSPEETVEGLPRSETLIMTETAEAVIFDSFNPFIPMGMHGAYGPSQLLIERLFYVNYATGEKIFWLATGYEYSKDFKTFVLHIRKGVTWSDGEPFTSKDIAFTVNMLKKNPALYGSSFYNEWVSNVSTPDDFTIVFNLTKPNPLFHFAIRGQVWVPEHIWKDKDPSNFKNNPPIFTGPYKLFKVLPDKKMYIYVRRDDYWGKALGYFPEPKYVIWKESSPPDIEAVEVIKNQIDHAHRVTYSCPLLVSLHDANKNITLAGFWDPCPRGVWINCYKYPLNYSQVRWAISYCVNREKLAKIIWAPFETIPAKYPWSVYAHLKPFIFSDVLAKYNLTYDPQKAEKILDDLGFKKGPDGIRVTPNGTRLSFTIITPAYVGGPEYTIAFDLAQELTKIGIEAKVKTLPWATFDELTSTGQFDITSHWLCGAWDDPRQLYDTFHSKYIVPIGTRAMAGNWVRLKDPEFDAVIDELNKLSPDDPNALPVYKKALEIYMRDLPGIPVVQTIFVMDFDNTYWTGWPTQDNLYIQPFTWWDSFLLIMFHLKPVKPAAPAQAVLPPGLIGNLTAINNRISNLSNQVTSLGQEIATLKSNLGTIVSMSALTIIILIIGMATILITIRKK
ncbi:MAG: ABC transporter substrate-binding protein [Thermoproteota archaeon]